MEHYQVYQHIHNGIPRKRGEREKGTERILEETMHPPQKKKKQKKESLWIDIEKIYKIGY